MYGIIGSGSWATALTKILTDKKYPVNWWIRNAANIDFIKQRKHNPHYLSSVLFDTSLLNMSDDILEVVKNSDTLIIGIPSAYAVKALEKLTAGDLENKKIVSAIKGLVAG
jgi:glycerol-3-phosphate dehydrogenase (NAD(P)+)